MVQPDKFSLSKVLKESRSCYCVKLVQLHNIKDFNKGNDPYGEHDMGAFTFKAQKFFWKIDYYDSELLYGVDPYEEPESVKRILTIMLANEYWQVFKRARFRPRQI